MRLFLGAFLLVLTAGCMPEAGNMSVGDDQALASAAGQPTQNEIIGEYVVTYVDGAPPTINIQGHEPTITIGKERIHFQSQCIYADWTYKLDGESLSTAPYYKPGSSMCARGLAPGETAIQTTFDSPETIRRIRSGLYLEGGGHRLQLQRKMDEAEIASRVVDLAGTWRVAAIDGRDINGPDGIALTADHEQIWWEPTCAAQYRAYAIEGSRFDTTPVDLSAQGACDIGFPAELPRIWSAMDAADRIERAPANGVLISGNGRSIRLFSH